MSERQCVDCRETVPWGALCFVGEDGKFRCSPCDRQWLRARVSSLSALVTKACEALEAAKRIQDYNCAYDAVQPDRFPCLCGHIEHNAALDAAIAELRAGLE